MKKNSNYLNLIEYINNDMSYQSFLKGNKDLNDFDMFCVSHCQDIKELIDDNSILEEKLFEDMLLIHKIKEYCINVKTVEPNNDKVDYILDLIERVKENNE